MRAAAVVITPKSAQIVRWTPGAIWRRRIDGAQPGGLPIPPQPVRDLAARLARDEERLRLFFAEVIHVLAADDELLLLGERGVVEEFAARLALDDLARGRVRRVEVRVSGPLSDRQLVGRVRAFARQAPG